jgi:hypothetical protein
MQCCRQHIQAFQLEIVIHVSVYNTAIVCVRGLDLQYLAGVFWISDLQIVIMGMGGWDSKEQGFNTILNIQNILTHPTSTACKK